MKKTFSTIIVLFELLILLNGVTTTTDGSKVRPAGGCATTTSTKTTQTMEDVSCKPKEERTFIEKTLCFQLKQFGLLIITFITVTKPSQKSINQSLFLNVILWCLRNCLRYTLEFITSSKTSLIQ